jgi:hypothetical protein
MRQPRVIIRLCTPHSSRGCVILILNDLCSSSMSYRDDDVLSHDSKPDLRQTLPKWLNYSISSDSFCIDVFADIE